VHALPSWQLLPTAAGSGANSQIPFTHVAIWHAVRGQTVPQEPQLATSDVNAVVGSTQASWQSVVPGGQLQRRRLVKSLGPQ
jgi:hypothetical protein